MKILYHKNCADGFCAAWLLHMCYPDGVFLPVNYGYRHPAVGPDAVIIVDFSYPEEVLREMAAVAERVTVIDHHESAVKRLQPVTDWPENLAIHLATGKSGARMTMEWLQQQGRLPQDFTSWLVDYTEDRDLWRWQLPHSREIMAALRSYPFDFRHWDRLHALGESARDALQAEGAAILRWQEQVVLQHVRNAEEIELAGYKVLAVNATMLFSEIAGALAEDRPFGVCWFDRADGKRGWSLRSRDGGVNVAEIAMRYGGGGHPQAAGFETIRPDLSLPGPADS